MNTPFTTKVGIRYPIICGAMFPCSNLELVAAVSEAGGIGIVQPVSLVYVFRQDLRESLRRIRSLTANPIGFNALVEKSSKTYEERMRRWVAIALEEGVKFFITALGNPRWVVDMVHSGGGIVFHDVTSGKWADKALAAGVDGLICVNRDAGGHAGERSAVELYEELAGFGVPLVCAGGIGDGAGVAAALELGYQAVQLGTRFIASEACTAHEDWKQAILNARAEDIVLTRRITGVPVAVINTPHVQALGTEAGPIARLMLKNRRTRHWVRLFYALRSLRSLKKANLRGNAYREYYLAGKSAGCIESIQPVPEIMAELTARLRLPGKG
ncbi:nitronate monooxygenase [bacterium]|nr:nitronate monooxygenase [candidate division CSSED10-310 bacterium]